MKKALSAVLVLALVFTFAQAGFTKASAYVDGPYTFTLSGSFATITKYTGPGGSLVIPENMSGSYPVVGIGSNAFSYHTTLTSVTLPIYCYSIEQQRQLCELYGIDLRSSAFNVDRNPQLWLLPLQQFGSSLYSGQCVDYWQLCFLFQQQSAVGFFPGQRARVIGFRCF